MGLNLNYINWGGPSILSWGAARSLNMGVINLSNEGDERAAYLKAVKSADKGDYSLLLAFARS